MQLLNKAACLSTLELISAELLPQEHGASVRGAATASLISDHSRVNAYILGGADLLLGLSLFSPAGLAALLPTATLLATNAVAGLYPGFGLMSAERLRRRWCFGALVLIPLAVLMPGYSLLQALSLLLLAPIAEAATRYILYRFDLWGMPARVTGDCQLMLEQNWYLGLRPALQQDCRALVIHKGHKPEARTLPTDLVFLAQDGGLITRLRPSENSLASWIGQAKIRHPQLAPWRQIKRAMDIAISSALLAVTAPLMLFAMLAIYVCDPGPVIYTQQRRGLLGQPVTVYKLRSMYQDSAERLKHILNTDAHAAHTWYSCFKLQPDPRILPFIGGFIRAFSIDELPQLINILKGEMSLVGPRIFVDYDLEIYPPELLKLRQSVPAGLTGLWQVSVRSDGDNADKVRYDAAYVRSWSLWQDIDILYRTAGAVLTGRGAR